MTHQSMSKMLVTCGRRGHQAIGNLSSHIHLSHRQSDLAQVTVGSHMVLRVDHLIQREDPIEWQQ